MQSEAVAEVSHRGTGPARLPGLDGIRAIAVLLVMAQHFFPTSMASPRFVKVVQRGGFGVETFFVLSGFLISYLLLLEERTKNHLSLAKFYARRSIRIAPPLIAFLGFLIALSLSGIVEVEKYEFISCFFFVRNYYGSAPETGHLWTLAIEEQFYIVWPIFLVVFKSSRVRIALTSAVVIASPFWRFVNYRLAGGASLVNSWRTDLRMEPLAIGALLALLVANSIDAKPLSRISAWKVCCLIASAVCLGVILYTDLLNLPIIRGFVPSLSWVCVAVILYVVVNSPGTLLTSALEFKPLAWVGMLSYSLYLWQQPFAPYVTGASPAWFRNFPINLVFAIGLAVCSFYLVERPLLSLRRRLR